VRRGQILSMDALISVVLVIMILGTLASASDNLKYEITSLVNWYERANVADNMLDVLVKTPGVPADWEENPAALKHVGLAGHHGGIAEKKVKKLLEILGKDDEVKRRVVDDLLNLSMGNDFELVLYTGYWNVTIDYEWNPFGGDGEVMETTLYDCSNATEIKYENDPGPALIDCDLLTLRNETLSSHCPICVKGSVLLDGSRSEVLLSGTCSQTGTYGFLSVLGDVLLINDGSRAIKNSYGDVYIAGGIKISGVENGVTVDLKARNIYVFGSTEEPVLDLKNGSNNNILIQTIGGHIFILVSGDWYALTGDPKSLSSWYYWNGSAWKSADDRVQIQERGSDYDVYIGETHVIEGDSRTTWLVTGGELPSDWQPPGFRFCGGSGLPLEITGIEGDYHLPAELEANTSGGIFDGRFERFTTVIAGLDGEVGARPSDTTLATLKARRENSPWAVSSRMITFMEASGYPGSLDVGAGAEGERLFYNVMTASPPLEEKFKITVSGDEGYAILLVDDGGRLRVLGVWKTRTSNVTAALWNVAGSVTMISRRYSGNERGVEVPVMDLFHPLGNGERERSVGMIVYRNTFPSLSITDTGTFSSHLGPRMEPAIVRIWVWGG